MKNASLDGALIVGGAGLSILFVSTDGGGQAPLPVAGGMLLVIAVVAVVSFALASIVRTLPLAILGSAAITELAFLLYFVCRVAYGRHVHEHAFEELYLLPVVFAVATAPTVLLSCVGFGRMANRVFQRRTEPGAAPKGGSAEPLGSSNAGGGPPSVS